jgi:hypothetical protein
VGNNSPLLTGQEAIKDTEKNKASNFKGIKNVKNIYGLAYTLLKPPLKYTEVAGK